MAYSHCSLFLQKLLICQCHTALGVSRKTTAGGESAEARALLGADPGASVAELVDAGDSHSPGMLQVQACMPCGFDSRLGHHQPAGARQEQGRPTPLSKRSYGEPCQQSEKRSTCCREKRSSNCLRLCLDYSQQCRCGPADLA